MEMLAGKVNSRKENHGMALYESSDSMQSTMHIHSAIETIMASTAEKLTSAEYELSLCDLTGLIFDHVSSWLPSDIKIKSSSWWWSCCVWA